MVLLMFSVPAVASESVECSSVAVAADLEAIMSSPGIGTIYTRDGAGDGTIADATRMSALASRVDHVLQCGAGAAPYLVSHLDDSRPTSATIDGTPVAVGFICLDLLTVLVHRPSPAMVTDCETDGLCACCRYGFCFDPAGYEIRVDTGENVEVRPSPTPSEVKKRWEALLASGPVEFSYPEWYEARYRLVRAKAQYMALGYERLAAMAGKSRTSVVHTDTTNRTLSVKVVVKAGVGDSPVKALFWVSSGPKLICESSFEIDRRGKVHDEY